MWAVWFRCFGLSKVALGSGEKRKIPEALTLEDAKRIRVMGDIPMELVNEVMMTITDPAAMLGPEVGQTVGGKRGISYFVTFLLKCVTRFVLIARPICWRQMLPVTRRPGWRRGGASSSSTSSETRFPKSQTRKFWCGWSACRTSSLISYLACPKSTSRGWCLTRE